MFQSLTQGMEIVQFKSNNMPFDIGVITNTLASNGEKLVAVDWDKRGRDHLYNEQEFATLYRQMHTYIRA